MLGQKFCAHAIFGNNDHVRGHLPFSVEPIHAREHAQPEGCPNPELVAVIYRDGTHIKGWQVSGIGPGGNFLELWRTAFVECNHAVFGRAKPFGGILIDEHPAVTRVEIVGHDAFHVVGLPRSACVQDFDRVLDDAVADPKITVAVKSTLFDTDVIRWRVGRKNTLKPAVGLVVQRIERDAGAVINQFKQAVVKRTNINLVLIRRIHCHTNQIERVGTCRMQFVVWNVQPSVCIIPADTV